MDCNFAFALRVGKLPQLHNEIIRISCSIVLEEPSSKHYHFAQWKFRPLKLFCPRKNASPKLPLINRRDLIRAALFASAASALGAQFSFAQAISSGLTPAARGEDGSKVSNRSQLESYFSQPPSKRNLNRAERCDHSIHRYSRRESSVGQSLFDLLLSVQPAEFQTQFVDALAFHRYESQKQFAKDFRELAMDDQSGS